jgi:hypothetical protein
VIINVFVLKKGWEFKTYSKRAKNQIRKDFLIENFQANQPVSNFQTFENETIITDYYDLLEMEHNYVNADLLENIDIEGSQSAQTAKKYVTAREYYAYRMQDRYKSHLQYFGRLYHQYIVDNYSKIELGRLNFIRFNQQKLRVDQYQGLFDAMNENDTIDANSLGKVFVLPSSFTGGPRNMTKLYQDAMAGVRVHGKPDFFLTFTTNPNWPEITNELIEGQTPNDRPDLVSRVFRLKLKSLMDDILNKSILGIVVSHVYVIEFQKRGLPHAHILICVREEDKIKTSDQVNDIVSAEIPDKEKHPLAYKTVTSSLMHGPCGPQFPYAR